MSWSPLDDLREDLNYYKNRYDDSQVRLLAALIDAIERIATLEARILPGPSPEHPAHMAEEIAESEAEATARLR